MGRIFIALLLAAGALAAPRIAHACTSDAQCGAGVCDPASHLCVGCLDSTRCSGPAPVCDPVAKFCASCNADFGGAGTLKCPSAPRPSCQTSGALSGQCTECSATNTNACAANAVKPKCDITTGTCGCTGDGDCRSGLYCDTNIVATGLCYFGCHVVGGTDHCGAGQYCDVRDGTIGNCAAEPCNGSADCGAGRVCDTSKIPHACVECLADGDCGAGRMCDTATHKCSAPPERDAGNVSDASVDSGALGDAATDATLSGGGGPSGGGCAITMARREAQGAAGLYVIAAIAAMIARRRRTSLSTGNFQPVGTCSNGRHEMKSDGPFGLCVGAAECRSLRTSRPTSRTDIRPA